MNIFKKFLMKKTSQSVSVLEIKEALYRADTKNATVTPIPLISDIASKITARNWRNICLERISLWCTNYFDAGQASWAYPWREESLYKAWLDEVSLDSYMDLVGLKGLDLSLVHFQKILMK